MLISKVAKVRWNNRNKKYYIDKKYVYTNNNDEFNVKVEDLLSGCHSLVEVKCDYEKCQKINSYFIPWKDYLKKVKSDGKYYCRECAMILYGTENRRISALKNSISFAQWGIDNFGEDFLEKYWDYDKNILEPFNISYRSNKKIWIKCQEKDYHNSYDITPSHFVEGKRCSYCRKINKIHILDSLSSIYPEVLEIWSDDNKKDPYTYSCSSAKIVYWKCKDKKHKDYKRNIDQSKRLNFRCPECDFSKGEQSIKNILDNRKILFIPQKEFDNLLGINGGNLSYDFYLPDYNLLIEYQGEFHDNNKGKGTSYMKSKFSKQQEHDRRKREFALNNNINLLEIWYWDFDKIEEILDKQLLI